MKSAVEKLSDTRVKLTVTVDFDELSGELDQAYRTIAQQVQIPGFRPGKAPRQLIDARFGRGPILEQVVNDIVPVRFQQAVNEENLNPLGQPSITDTKIEDKDFVEFVAEFDVRPEFEVPDFSEISVEVPAVEVSDEDVDADIDQLRDRFAEEKTTKRKLKTDDIAVISLEASIDGEDVEDLAEDKLHYRVGEGGLFPGLDTALRGLKACEDNEFESKLDFDSYEGKTANVKVTVHETKERALPKLDDEFVQEASELDTVDELREQTRRRLEERRKTQQASTLRDEVLKKALEATEFPLPEGVIDEQVANQHQQLLGQLANDEASLNSTLEQAGIEREEFDKEQRENAEQAVRTQLFLDALAEREEPEVSQQDLNDHILFTAQSYGMDPYTFVQQLNQSGQMANLYADVRRGKALAAAICRTSAKDENGKDVDPKEFFGEEDEQGDTAAEEAAAAEEKNED